MSRIAISYRSTLTLGTLPTKRMLWDRLNLIFGLGSTEERRHAHLIIDPGLLKKLSGLMNSNYFSTLSHFIVITQLLQFYYNRKFHKTNISVNESTVNKESNLI